MAMSRRHEWLHDKLPTMKNYYGPLVIQSGRDRKQRGCIQMNVVKQRGDILMFTRRQEKIARWD